MTEFRPGRFEVLPLIIKNLLIINVLFFLAQKTFESIGVFRLEDILALHHVKSPLFQPWQLITYMFLHGDIMHLIGNMFALWMFGTILEDLWGPKRFLTFYFICGIGAGLIHLAFLWFDYNSLLVEYMRLKQAPSPEGITNFFQHYGGYAYGDSREEAMGRLNTIQAYLDDPYNKDLLRRAMYALADFTSKIISFPTIGASGAVFGILAAFVYLFPNTYIYLYFLVPIKAKWMGLAYFGLEVYYAIQNSAGDNVARWAHIGGGLVGFILVLTWNKTNRKTFY